MAQPVKRGVVHLIGAGPGDPELITVRGWNILKEADVVLYAGSLVSKELVEAARPGAEKISSADLHLDEMVEIMVEAARKNQVVARVHSGDPTVYGAILEQVARLRKHGIPFEIVPGVCSAFAAAARVGAELTVPEVSQTVILTRTGGRASPVPEGAELRELARHPATLAIFLSAARIHKVAGELREAGLPEETPVVVAEKVTWPGERVIRTTLARLESRIREAGITRHAMILVGKALDPGEAGESHRSRLYDPEYAHLFRPTVKEG
ncbi:precorrin-4/cobalt-precorrin-4 C11-methyltransferase [Melghirimyces profundicolus]|uniref:Precorrin-4/cobalt-precorrin-4 C11-methyltransferase n=1 Tax=Melghirimyces profundicolus TaxID=1242148 RepID=A0A2T6C8C6_9BACL|nr:precorrin-4 C(11)-methyltransferase [Melghirimyces profundicolus]PTX64571.1 precorrin-4/cobalt-precorrin-4 C11-methyltransferase [Melghirimyces profundicolus]